MNPRLAPFVRLLLPFVVGIILADALALPAPNAVVYGLLSTMFVLVLAAWRRFAYRWRWLYGSASTLLLIAAGYIHTTLHDERTQPAHFAGVATLPQKLFILATVYEAPSRGGKVKVPLRVEAVGNAADSLATAAGNLLVFLNADSLSESLRYGDRLIVACVVRATEGPKNPHAFDYRRYLSYQNIHYQAFVHTDSLQVLATGQGNACWRLAYHCRDRLLGLLQRHFPTLDEYAAASALLVGYRDDLSDEMRAVYAETGSMHALAVSGTHVGFLYAGLMLGLGRLPLRGRSGRLLQTALVLAAIWAFTLLTGATASVLRASVMFSTYLLGKALYREAPVWNILAASAFGLLVFNPYFLFDAGFQLSYAAVAGMVFFYPKLYRLSPPLPRLPDEGLKVLLVGVAAQLGTLPLTLYYFNQFPVYFWLSGWVVVLGGALFLWGGALLVLLDFVSVVLAEWFGKMLYALVWGINWCVFRISELPFSIITGIWLEVWGAVLLTLVLLCVAVAWETKRGRFLLPAVAMLVVLFWHGALVKVRQMERQKVVVYHVNRQHLVDCFDGLQVFRLRDSLSDKQEQFAAQRQRWALRVEDVTELPYEKNALNTDHKFIYREPFLYIGGKTIAIINDASLAPSGAKRPFGLTVSAVVLTHNAKVNVADCRVLFPDALLVFDSSNKPWRVEKWKKACENIHAPYHDVRTSGAWVLNL